MRRGGEGERRDIFIVILSHCRKGRGCCENSITWQSSHPVNEGCVFVLSTGDVRGINGVWSQLVKDFSLEQDQFWFLIINVLLFSMCHLF